MHLIELVERLKELSNIQADRIAINYGDCNVTYSQLEQVSNWLAQNLIDIGSEHKKVIILMDRSPLFIESMLGIWKAGSIVIPLDTTINTERCIEVIQETKPEFILCDRKSIGKVYRIITKYGLNIKQVVIDFDTDDQELQLTYPNVIYWNLNNYTSVVHNVRQYMIEKYCYIFFTTGSTGKPKAVLGVYRSLMHFITWEINEFSLNEMIKGSQLINTSFDAILRDILVPLCAGGTLYIPKDSDIVTKPSLLIHWLSNKQITLMHTVPSIFKMMSYQKNELSQLMNLRYILLAGELLRGADLTNLYSVLGDQVQVVNFYGTTETTMIKAFYRIPCEDKKLGIIPVGKGIDSSELLILDDNMQKCPCEVIGNIYIHTPFISAGYMNDKDLTKKVFVKNPFTTRNNDFIYDTGDLGRRLEDGNVVICGRKDMQVKIHGIRIELGEIEHKLLMFGPIKEALVIAQRDDNDIQYLIAYIVCDKNLDYKELKNYLIQKLPHYMLPSQFRVIKQLALNENGKVDRKVVKNIPYTVLNSNEYEKPSNELEKQLCSIWSEVLENKNIGINDNFFMIGGHSLKAGYIISKMDSKLHLKISIAQLFEHATIKELASFIQQTEFTHKAEVTINKLQDNYPLTDMQLGAYMDQIMDPCRTTYNMPFIIRLHKRIEKEELERVCNELLCRHEALRTKFVVVDGEPRQSIIDFVSVKVDCIKVEQDTEEELVKYIKPFELDKPPLFRVVLLEKSDSEFILLFDIHHIISDGISVNILANEFFRLLQHDKLRYLEKNYRDYLAWKDNDIHSKRMRVQEGYWKNKIGNKIPYIKLPAKYNSESGSKTYGKPITIDIDKNIYHNLKDFCNLNHSTTFIYLITCYCIWLKIITRENEIVVGSSFAGRSQNEYSNLVGMFINTLPLKLEIKDDMSFMDCFLQMKKTVTEAYDNQDYSILKLVKIIQTSREKNHPLYSTIFDDEKTGTFDVKQFDNDFEVSFYKDRVAKADLVFSVLEDIDNSIHILAEYNHKRVSNQIIDLFRTTYLQIIDETIDDPNIKILDILKQLSKDNSCVADTDKEMIDDYKKTDIDSLFNFDI